MRIAGFADLRLISRTPLLMFCSLMLAFASGCLQSASTQPAASKAETRACGAPQAATTKSDRLIGWYSTTDGQRIIPVFKHGENYYSVCRGCEVPLKESPAGLEWAIEPSSMKGTTIGFDEQSGECYLAVFDAQAAHTADGRYGVGEREPLKRIAEPSWVLSTKAAAPTTNEDFFGWYQAVWFPYMRWELRREGGGVVMGGRMYLNSSWQEPEGSWPVKPLDSGLGFAASDRSKDMRLEYNASQQRYELVFQEENTLRMPLARIAPPQPGDPAPDVKTMRVGIPSWH